VICQLNVVHNLASQAVPKIDGWKVAFVSYSGRFTFIQMPQNGALGIFGLSLQI
jgi:hypothetical protein